MTEPIPSGPIQFDPAAKRAELEGTLPGHLAIELIELATDRVVSHMTVGEEHLHSGRYVHGGVWMAFGDTVAAWGAEVNLMPGFTFVTAELKLNVMSAGRLGDELTGIGIPLHVGKRTQVWEVKISKHDKLVANFVCTQLVLEKS